MNYVKLDYYEYRKSYLWYSPISKSSGSYKNNSADLILKSIFYFQGSKVAKCRNKLNMGSI